jgi:4-hydroxybenzoate polyprenyltransferase
VAAGQLLPTAYSALFTLPAFFAREVLKTVPDYEGDRANGVDNIATRYGPKTALRVGQIALLLTACALPLVRLIWALNPLFLIIVFMIIWPLTLRAILKSSVAEANGLIRVSKLLFLLVAVVLLIGSI